MIIIYSKLIKFAISTIIFIPLRLKSEAFFRFRGQESPILLPKSEMITKEQIVQIVEKHIDPKTQFLVEVTVAAGNKIFVALDGYKGISIDYCIEISRAIESNFDREVEDFELEVSSAGLSEPFRVIEQYKKNIGNQIEILLKDGKKIAASLTSVIENGINVVVEKTVKEEGSKKKQKITEPQFIEFEKIKHTKLILIFK